WISALHMCGYYLNALSQLLGVLMSLTAIFLPIHFNKIWCRPALVLWIVLCLILSIVPSWLLLYHHVEFY
ncbi:hypothetical protein PMAYCL1PPCAC_32845, partial [Pristionchus mayeri]